MHIRFVTAAALFDGHDVSINIIRRLLQRKGVEVIHLGHNRSVREVVTAAISEDVQGIAISSYQGGHKEYFLYLRKLLDEQGGNNIKIFGGGGGVITHKEIKELEACGIEKIYSPEDGMSLGILGIIDDMIKRTASEIKWDLKKDTAKTAKVISYIEEFNKIPFEIVEKKTPVLGVTGTGGAGKSSLIDEILLRFNLYYPNKKIALISIDPTKSKTKGALLGDRIRLGSATNDNFFIRSFATRESGNELSVCTKEVVRYLRSLEYDLIIVESSGIGQASHEITKIADKCLYVMTPEYGAPTQLEKIDMLEFADIVALNKFEKPKALDAIIEIRKQYQRNFNLFDKKGIELPIFGTIASQFNDQGVNALFVEINKILNFDITPLKNLPVNKETKTLNSIIPKGRENYLREIANLIRSYEEKTKLISEKIHKIETLEKAGQYLESSELKNGIESAVKSLRKEIPLNVFDEIVEFDKTVKQYNDGEYVYQVRNKDVKVKTKYTSLSGLNINKVGVPDFKSKSEKYSFIKLQNLPGFFPYAAGVFPFRRADEDPKRQFAGEGGPKRTNARFHYLSKNDSAKRLSTAFDSVTLYGEDPNVRPDIFGKIGEAGVSICTLDDMLDLYKGFDLTDANTSVSMTINGPASIILAMFMNTAIKQKLGSNEKDLWDQQKRIDIMRAVRGTVQADILKEDQAQNTCIFSLEFALKLMGDVQEYFSKNKIYNYYTVSISGYHIAEAGANPITQLAFTLANGFTYVEYYLNRGIHIDDFCPNLSFFFSNGLDPEYSVIGRVARKVWAIAMKERYGANEKSQKLKYHIQTSGRSLHAQEIDFNDIRTTLQALLALNDNCNSLHTNAYDEAVTTPTEESVRRAMAIQMIITKEFGLNKSDNSWQGSYVLNELEDLVEKALLVEFERISDRGGVLGAMENMYQRGKIQEESLLYETLKDNGELPIIGVNTFLNDKVKEQMQQEIKITRASNEEKQDQIDRLNAFKKKNSINDQGKKALTKLKQKILNGENSFEELLNTVNYCSLGEITECLFELGGRYRRNM
ncbi:MAG: fused isobutyryl-CoA mutase/GTPase IcmF [Bacteriovoracaceae bacterium]